MPPTPPPQPPRSDRSARPDNGGAEVSGTVTQSQSQNQARSSNDGGGTPQVRAFVQRQTSANATPTNATVATSYDFKLTLELGDVDALCPEPVTTDMGKMVRLQIMGLFNRPLGSPATVLRDCLTVCWRHFKNVICQNDDDATCENLLVDQFKQYVIEDARLPLPDNFCRINAPGGIPVFYHAATPEAAAGTPYKLGGNRYAIEQEFYNNNPTLGKIPIIATVMQRAKGSSGPWQPANMRRVYFQLVKPADISGAPTNMQPAAMRSSGVTRTRTGVDRGRGFVVAETVDQKTSGAGPDRYMQDIVRAYDPSSSTDPQSGNVHWHLGGKRKLGVGGEAYGARSWSDPGGIFKRDNVFGIFGVPGFHAAHTARPLPHTPLTVAISPDAPGNPVTHPNAVRALTNVDGKAGVIFMPSLIGGDRYRLRAYLGSQPAETTADSDQIVSTGTMIRWRTMRVSRYIQNDTPDSEVNLDKTVREDVIGRYGSKCNHTGARTCWKCISREGRLPVVDLPAFIKTELAKGYCDLIIEPKARKPQSMYDPEIKAAMQRAWDFVKLNQPTNIVRQQVVARFKKWTLLKQTTQELKLEHSNLVGGSLVIKLDGVIVARDKGDGTLDDVSLTDRMKGGSGTINYTEGKVTLKWGKARPRSGVVTVEYGLDLTQDFDRLFYIPSGPSPFLFNLYMPETYRERSPSMTILFEPNHNTTVPVFQANFIGLLTSLMENLWLPRFLEEIDEGRFFLPGIILLHTSMSDTWRSVFPSGPGVKGLQGKGMASGVLLTEGSYHVKDSYLLKDVDKKYSNYSLNSLALHEMGHCFYLQHALGAGGAVPDMHDYHDNCVMSYLACPGDLCGCCMSTLMGMNTRDPRFRTYDEKGVTSVGQTWKQIDHTSLYNKDPTG